MLEPFPQGISGGVFSGVSSSPTTKFTLSTSTIQLTRLPVLDKVLKVRLKHRTANSSPHFQDRT